MKKMKTGSQWIAGALAGAMVAVCGGPASAQVGVDTQLELGAQVCGSAPLPFESDAEHRTRIERERKTPRWVYLAEQAMFEGGDKMSFTPRVENGQKILMASGGIDSGAAARLKEALKLHAPIAEVWFNSPGGDSRVGTEMGDILRSEMIATRVRKGHGCASACSTAFIGGVLRRVEPGAGYGVHMYKTGLTDYGKQVISAKGVEDQYNYAQQQGAAGAAQRILYVQKMGVSARWLDVWSNTRQGCMTYLSQKELRDMFVNNID